MGKSTISMAIFNSYVKLPEGNKNGSWPDHLRFKGILCDKFMNFK